MNEKQIQPVILSQLEDVLEERQKSDRRKNDQDAAEVVEAERRVQSRRESVKTD